MKCKTCHRVVPDALLLNNNKCVWCDGAYHKIGKGGTMNKTKKEQILHDMLRIGQALKILRNELDKENRITLIELLQEQLDRLYGDINGL